MQGRTTDPVIGKVLSEKTQNHSTRKHLFEAVETELGRPLVTLFTSFTFPVMLEDADVDVLAGVLQKLDTSRGFALMISSPGGDGLSSERMINACRSYSGTGEYWAIVPGKAKSAATMVCFGASKILMGPTSELGPVDPQVPVRQESTVRRFSAYNIIQSYEELFVAATTAEGNLEPFLQQLARYDAREIKELRAVLALSEDISIGALESGMMKGQPKEAIKARIAPFLTPEMKKTHGRPICRDEASECGLAVEPLDPASRTWALIYELYIRTNDVVSSQAAKCIETGEHSFAVQAVRG